MNSLGVNMKDKCLNCQHNKAVKLNEVFKGITGEYRLIFENIYTGEKRVSVYNNIFVTAGFNAITRRLAQEANDGDITYVAVGTDNTAPVVADTTLGTELDRNLVSTISASGATVTVRGFFGAAEANGTLEEMGLFGEAATAAADSGTMFTHALISETKTSSETLTFEITITLA